MHSVSAFDSTDATASGPDAAAVEARELDLWRRLHEHADAAAREELIGHYRPFAKVVAATYYGRRIDDDIDFDDYHQWALLAMIESVDRFDPRRGVQFKTFASRRMHGCIVDGIESSTEKHRQIAMRRRLREERTAVTLAAATAASSGRPAGSDIFEVLAEIGIGLALGLMLENSGMIAPPPDAIAPDQAYSRLEIRQLAESVRCSLGQLSEQEQTVIRAHYTEDMRFNDISTRLGLTKGRVSQIHHQALGKLRQLLGEGAHLDVAL